MFYWLVYIHDLKRHMFALYDIWSYNSSKFVCVFVMCLIFLFWLIFLYCISYFILHYMLLFQRFRALWKRKICWFLAFTHNQIQDFIYWPTSFTLTIKFTILYTDPFLLRLLLRYTYTQGVKESRLSALLGWFKLTLTLTPN